MYIKTILICVAFVVFTKSHDVTIGQSDEGRKIFDEKREASPALWKQISNVTVNTTDAEVISKVVITDLRPEKDGDAKIVEGGEGKKNVTIELKSPTALRGYDFHIEVYSITDENAPVNPTSTVLPAATIGKGISNPASLSSESDIPRQARDATLATSTTIIPTDLGNSKSMTAENNENVTPSSPTVSTFGLNSNPSTTNSQENATHIPVTIGKDLNVNEHRLTRDTINEGTDKPRGSSQKTTSISSTGTNDQVLTSTQASVHVHEYQNNQQAFGQKTPFVTLNVASTNAPTTENIRNSRDTEEEDKSDSNASTTLKDIEDENDKRSQTTENSRNARDTEGDNKPTFNNPRFNLNKPTKNNQGTAEQTTKTNRNARDTETESKTEVTFPRYNIYETRYTTTKYAETDSGVTETTEISRISRKTEDESKTAVNIPKYLTTSNNSRKTIISQTPEPIRSARDTEEESRTGVHAPSFNISGYPPTSKDDADDSKSQTTENFRNVRGTEKDNIPTLKNPRFNVGDINISKNNSKDTLTPTTETTRHVRDTAADDKTEVNIPRFNVGESRYNTTIEYPQKGLTTENTRISRDTADVKTESNPRFIADNPTTPKNAQDYATSPITETNRSARDTETDSTTEVNIPRYNINGNRYNPTKTGNDESSLAARQTTEKTRLSRDTGDKTVPEIKGPRFNVGGYQNTPKTFQKETTSSTTENARFARDDEEQSKTKVNTPRLTVSGAEYSTTPINTQKDTTSQTAVNDRKARDTAEKSKAPVNIPSFNKYSPATAKYADKEVTTENTRVSRDTEENSKTPVTNPRFNIANPTTAQNGQKGLADPYLGPKATELSNGGRGTLKVSTLAYNRQETSTGAPLKRDTDKVVNSKENNQEDDKVKDHNERDTVDKKPVISTQ